MRKFLRTWHRYELRNFLWWFAVGSALNVWSIFFPSRKGMRQNAHNIWCQFAYINNEYAAADAWTQFAWSWERDQDANGNRIDLLKDD